MNASKKDIEQMKASPHPPIHPHVIKKNPTYLVEIRQHETFIAKTENKGND